MAWISDAFAELKDKFNKKQTIVIRSKKKMADDETEYYDETQEYDESQMQELTDELPMPPPPLPKQSQRADAAVARRQPQTQQQPFPKIKAVPVMQQQQSAPSSSFQRNHSERKKQQQTAEQEEMPEDEGVSPKDTSFSTSKQQVDLNALLSVMLQRIENLEQDVAAIIRIIKR